MSHATEGELHAWIDGAVGSLDPGRAERLAAHLRSCADCRTRLEEARALRARASGILDGAFEGRVEAPPFEAVRARAGSGSSGAGDPARRTRGGTSRSGGSWSGRGAPPLARAAAILVAVGAGWLGHAVWTGSAGGPEAGPPAPEGREPILEGEGPAEPRLPAATVGEADEAAGLRDAIRSVETREREPGGESEGRLAGAQRRAEPASADQVARVDRDAAPGRQKLPGAAAASAEARPPAGAEAELRPAPLAASPTAEAVEREVWLAVSEEDAARWLGGRPPRVPELAVTDAAISTRDGNPVARIGQRLPDGERLEFVVERLSAPAEAAARTAAPLLEQAVPAAPARGEAAAAAGADDPLPKAAEGSLVVEAAGVRVRIAAPVATDSLRALLSRARGGERRGPEPDGGRR